MILDTWYTIDTVENTYIPERFYHWLTKPKILSLAMKARCDDFSMQVLDQTMTSLNSDDCEFLGLTPPVKGMVRQVMMSGDTIPWEFAYVVIPEQTLRLKYKDFQDLGHKPLGETLLYNDPTLQRSPFTIARLSVANPLLSLLKLHLTLPEYLWARRSRFSLQAQPLSVTEVFLPDIATW